MDSLPTYRLFVTLSVFALVGVACSDEPQTESDGADGMPTVTDLQTLIELDQVRAAVVAFYEGGDVDVRGLGKVSAESDRPPDAGTAFEIGSITKVFTVLLAQREVDAGRLTWDRTLADSFPDLEFENAEVGQITLGELASHSSGLPRIPDNMPMSDGTDPYEGYGRKELLEYLENYDPPELVKQEAYSNLGAGILGVIAADATSGDYSNSIRERVLEPLGLQHTHAGLVPLPDDLAAGFSRGADMANWDGFDALAGAGALVSTANDLLSFIDSNLNPEALREPLVTIREKAVNEPPVFGWYTTESKDGDTVFWHNGGTGGYASFLGIRPAVNKGVVILTTSTEYTMVTDIGLAAITEITAASSSAQDAPTGVFELAQGMYLTIYEEGGRIYGQATGQGAFPLDKTGDSEYTFEPASIQIAYANDMAGQVEEIVFTQNGKETIAPRVDESLGVQRRTKVELDAAMLPDFEGRYQLAPGAVLTVEARGEQLFAQLTGQGSIPVFPYETDKFFYRVVDAEIWFERNEEGAVVALVLHQAGQRRAPIIPD